MSTLIDMMPASCRKTLGHRSWVRRWVATYIGVVLVLAAGSSLARMGQSGLRTEVRTMTKQAEERWERNEEAQRLLAEIRSLEETITRYNRLAWPVRVSQVINSLAALAPDPVTITTLAITPRETRQNRRAATTGRRQNQKNEPEVVDSNLIIELEGLAPNDNEVALFVSGLEQHPLFSAVTLDFARSQMVDEFEARNFRITCRIDLNARYKFADATARGINE